MCPVQSYERYISKLHPAIDSLWQKPREGVLDEQPVWYCRMVLGSKSLGNMMTQMSTDYQLSIRYTNHSLSVMAISVLDDAGISGRHIIRISGHKSEESLKSYSRKVSNAKKRTISNTMSHALGVQNMDMINNAPPIKIKVPEDETASGIDITDSQMDHAIATIAEPSNISLSPLLALADNEPYDIMSASAKSTPPLDTIYMQHLLELSGTDFHINKSVVNINIYNK